LELPNTTPKKGAKNLAQVLCCEISAFRVTNVPCSVTSWISILKSE